MRELDKRSTFSHARKYFSTSNVQVSLSTRPLNDSLRICAGDAGTDKSIQYPGHRESQYFAYLDWKDIVEEEDTFVGASADVTSFVFTSLQASDISDWSFQAYI